MTQKQRQQKIKILTDQYETKHSELLSINNKFELHRLPPKVEEVVNFLIADAPSFSSIAALMTTNYALSHMIGQTRAEISDPIYSRDNIGINGYFINVSGSGSGKSSSTNKVLSLFKPAMEITKEHRLLKATEKAKQLAFAELRKADNKLQFDQLTEADYAPYMPKLPRITADSGSTRGGLATLMSKLQLEEFSTLSVAIDELAMSLKSGQTMDEVMLLLTSMYDMGVAESPEFKGEDAKEVSIEGIYPNLLAHTSPTMLFGDPQIRNKLSTLFSTSLARRSFYIHPDDDEACENNPIQDTIDERNHLIQARKELARNLAVDVAETAIQAISRLHSSPLNRLVKFSPEANRLYMEYFDMCALKAELLPESSIRQIEMAGRAWKLGKLAAIWALYEGSSIITKDVLASAIYMTEYITKYINKFIRLTTAQSFELMADEFLSGTRVIPLHEAVTKGYTTSKAVNFKDLLGVINSYLRLSGLVSYDNDTKSFVYSELEFVEPQEQTVEEEQVLERCHYTMSYTVLPDNTPKDERIQYLDSFTKYRNDLCEQNLINLLTRDTVYNTFQYKDAQDKHGNLVQMNRNRDNIISNTNLIILDVDKSQIDIHSMHDYLSDIPHILATTSDSSNLFKYRILLPVNVEIDGTNHRLYSYIVRKLAAELLIEVDKVSYSPSHPYYGYSGALTLSNNKGRLYDVTKYMTEFARGEDTLSKPLKVKPEFKTEKGRSNHVSQMLDNVDEVFQYAIEAPHGEGSLRLARMCMHCRDEGFTAEELETAVRYVNSCWESPMPDSRLEKTLLSTYMPQCTNKLPK